MSNPILLGNIELPGFFDYAGFPDKWSSEDIESIRDKNYGFIYIVTHVRHKPQFVNDSQYYYTNNFGVGWFVDLIIAINQSSPELRDIKLKPLINANKGKDISITYPEHYCTIEQQRHLKQILALIKPNKVKVLTNSPFVIQSCSHNELAIGSDGIDWTAFKNEQIDWLNKMNK